MATLGGSRKICVVEVCDYTWSPSDVPHMLSRGTPIVIDHAVGGGNVEISYGAEALNIAQNYRHALGVLSEAVSTQDVMVNGSARHSSGSKKRKRRVNIMALPLTFTGPEMCHSDTPHEGFAPGDFVFLIVDGPQNGYKLAAETPGDDSKAICVGRASVNAPPGSHCVQTFISPLLVAFDRSAYRPIPRNVSAQKQFIVALTNSVGDYNAIYKGLTDFGASDVQALIDDNVDIQGDIDKACLPVLVAELNVAASGQGTATTDEKAYKETNKNFSDRFAAYEASATASVPLNALVKALTDAIGGVKAISAGLVKAEVTISGYDPVAALDAFKRKYDQSLQIDFSLIEWGTDKFDAAQTQIEALRKAFQGRINAITNVDSITDVATWATTNATDLDTWATKANSITRD